MKEDNFTRTIEAAEAYEKFHTEPEELDLEEEEIEEEEDCGCSDPGCPCSGMKRGSL